MRLSSIKLAGFKSFVEPTKVPFPDQMTCVVGPNGCGKSNVIDAVRWVLGESSAKNLRGDAMTDVIFNGSTSRKPVSQASVELLFDNTEGRLPGTLVSRNQIAIKRVVTRDGQSLYYLNGDKCRKRDITDIFLGTGLGPRSYAIIEQGMISRLIESKPQDLRIFMEEAAGVSKYKERRRETETRLNSTRDNLERLLDLRNELHERLLVLDDQAKKAGKFKTLKKEERSLKAQICVLKWQQLQAKLLQSQDQLKQLDDEIAFYKTAHSGHDDVIESLKNEIALTQQQLDDIQHREFAKRTELAKTEQQKLHNQQVKQQLSTRCQKLQQQLNEAEQTKQQLSFEHQMLLDQQAEHQENVLLLASEVALLEAEYDELQEQQSDWYEKQNELQSKLNSEQQALTKATTDKANLTQQILLAEQQLNVTIAQLQEVSDALNELDLEALLQEQHQIKQVLAKLKAEFDKLLSEDAAKQEAQQLAEQALHKAERALQQSELTIASLEQTIAASVTDTPTSTVLVSQLKMATGWELAGEAALFGLAQASVVDNYASDADFSQIWPLDEPARAGSLAEQVVSGVYPSVFNHIALVEETADAYQNEVSKGFVYAINNAGVLYSNNSVCQNLADAASSILLKQRQINELKSGLEAQQFAVTEAKERLDDIVSARAENKRAIDQKQEEIHQLAKQDAAKQMAINLAEAEQLKLTKRSASLSALQLDTQQQIYDWQNALIPLSALTESLTAQLGQLQSALLSQQTAQQESNASVKRKGDVLSEQKQKYHQLALQSETLKGQLQLKQTSLQAIDDQTQLYREELEESALSLEEIIEPLLESEEQIQTQLLEIDEIVAEKVAQQAQLEGQKSALKEKESGVGQQQAKLALLVEQKQALALEQQSFLLKSEAALEPLGELNTTLKEVLETLDESVKLTSCQARLTKVSAAITALGAINLAAIDEFEQASTRKQYLDEQYEDLHEALVTLEGAIIKIDKETKQRFRQTFDAVNAGLQELFPKVFGGGMAYLELTSDDLLDTGVTIMARPPGKKNSTIHLLSGGEKALTALSLVFSIFRLNPSPFCMLDEVDAPLDDANVGRFCRLVEEMSQSVQFIYISHNKIAMEMAARLTGVTMAEPGVSRIVAVDIEKALELAES
jgi:chromosome segregation protein